MKMQIDMAAVYDILQALGQQNTTQSEELLKTIQKMFAPLLIECEGCVSAPTYNIDVVTPGREENKEIDWEQRRYEIAKDCAAAEISGVLSNSGAKSYLKIARNSVKMAEILIEKLKGESY